MKKFITALLENVISLWVIDYLMISIYIATPNALFEIAPGSYITGFPSAFIASILLSIANSAINSYIE